MRFERYTERARRTIVLASEKARFHKHHTIQIVHLLAALTHDSDSPAAQILATAGVTETEVAALMEMGDTAAPGHLPFADQTKHVLNATDAVCDRYGHGAVGVVHLLLGAIESGRAKEEFFNLGVDTPSLTLAATTYLDLLPTRHPTDLADGERTT